MSDHFAIVPRAFSDRFFAAMSTFYACDGQSWPPAEPWWQPRCRGGFFEETVQFRHLHASGVPYRIYFMFEYVVTRGALGGWCILGHRTFDEACQLLALAGEFQPPFTRWVVGWCGGAVVGWRSSSVHFRGRRRCLVADLVDGLIVVC